MMCRLELSAYDFCMYVWVYFNFVAQPSFIFPYDLAHMRYVNLGIVAAKLNLILNLVLLFMKYRTLYSI